MPQSINTAVIAAAGHATRMWPASKAIPKELFPLGRVPAIVHLFWEFVEAGIHKLVLVVGSEGLPLMERLVDSSIAPPPRVAGDPVVKRYQEMLARAEFSIIEQTGNYGNGTPLILAAKRIGEEPCIYAFGDDIVLGENVTASLIDTFARTGHPVLATQSVEPRRRSQFGIVECSHRDGIQYVQRLIEKPRLGETESSLASFGRYLVTPELMQSVKTVPPGRDGEVWFADSVIRRLSTGGEVCAYTLQSGHWYTVGDPISYAAAVQAATDFTTPHIELIKTALK